MLTIQVTQFGKTVRMSVEQIEIVQYCHWWKCRAEFTTVDPDQLYCKASHRVQACKDRTIGPTLAALAAVGTSRMGFHAVTA